MWLLLKDPNRSYNFGAAVAPKGILGITSLFLFQVQNTSSAISLIINTVPILSRAFIMKFGLCVTNYTPQKGVK